MGYTLTCCRGIPSGYISTLEQRLMETEGVLFCALSELRNLRSQPNSQPQMKLEPPTLASLGARETNPNKALRMAEWKEYPLRTNEQITRWEEFFSSKDRGTRSQGLSPWDAYMLLKTWLIFVWWPTVSRHKQFQFNCTTWDQSEFSARRRSGRERCRLHACSIAASQPRLLCVVKWGKNHRSQSRRFRLWRFLRTRCEPECCK